MFVKVSQESDLIRLPSQFARIVDVLENGDVIFEVRYNVRQSDIVRRSAQLVRVTASIRTLTQPSVIQMPGQAQPSNSQIVRNILTHHASIRNTIRNHAINNVVATKLVDNMSKLDFELIADLKKNENPRNVAGLYKPRLVLRSVNELNTQNDVKPILQVNRSPDDDDETTPIKHLIQKSILEHGFDPSHASNIVDDRVLTPRESVKGIFLKSTQMNDWNVTTRFFRKMTKPVKFVANETSVSSHDTNVLSLETTFTDDVTITSEITLPSDKIKDANGNFRPLFFSFDLLNSGGISTQTLREPVDVLKYLEAFYTPRTPPIVKFAKFDATGRANIQIKQTDSRATAVRVYRKDFSYTNNDPGVYQLVSEQEIACDGSFQNVSVEASPSFTTIYRVISVGKNEALSPEFTNVVVNPTKIIKRRTYVAMTSRVVTNGVNIDVTDVPLDVVSFLIYRKDRTVRGKFEAVGNEVIQVTPENETAVYTVTDTSVKKYHVYEYICRLYYKNGTTFDAGRVFIDYEPLVENLVDTKIEDIKVSYDIDNYNVTFKLTTVVNESDADSIKALLERQGLRELFDDDLLKERDKLQKLIAHQVYRVDLTDGTKENFGVITDEFFSDVRFRLINSVRPLQAGHAYRYEVVALLRAPETMFDEFVKTAVDATTKKKYTFKPSKFLHPITLKFGNITSSQTLSEHYPQAQLSFGSVGNIATAEVSFATDVVTVTNVSADAFDSTTHLIKWSIVGDPRQIDHFVVMKEFLGQRHIIGKCHAVNETTSFRFFYQLTDADLGEIEYIITPILDNYSVGSEFRTNRVTII